MAVKQQAWCNQWIITVIWELELQAQQGVCNGSTSWCAGPCDGGEVSLATRGQHSIISSWAPMLKLPCFSQRHFESLATLGGGLTPYNRSKLKTPQTENWQGKATMSFFMGMRACPIFEWGVYDVGTPHGKISPPGKVRSRVLYRSLSLADYAPHKIRTGWPVYIVFKLVIFCNLTSCFNLYYAISGFDLCYAGNHFNLHYLIKCV